jgi:lactoylglutathione lyase/glyoxylase I family protein
MIKGFAHVCLAAGDLAAAERFYCSGLGLKKAFDFIRGGKAIGFYLELPNRSYIEIFQRDEIDANAKSPIIHFCLEVENLDPVSQRLTENGYEVTKKALGADQSWQMWTTDPSGVKIEFHQYTERSSQITHANCILPVAAK